MILIAHRGNLNGPFPEKENHPNYIEGGVDEVLYCFIVGTTTVQINIDYLEV